MGGGGGAINTFGRRGTEFSGTNSGFLREDVLCVSALVDTLSVEVCEVIGFLMSRGTCVLST